MTAHTYSDGKIPLIGDLVERISGHNVKGLPTGTLGIVKYSDGTELCSVEWLDLETPPPLGHYLNRYRGVFARVRFLRLVARRFSASHNL